MVKRSLLHLSERIVIKVGTAVVTEDGGDIALSRVGSLVEQICQLRRQNKQVVLVTSGSVSIGRHKLRKEAKLSKSLRHHTTNLNDSDSSIGKDIEELDPRACAAAGQSGLMSLYEHLFGHYDITCAQILVTESEMQIKGSRDGIARTLERLLSLGIVPIVNENDATSIRSTPIRDNEKRIFWDNDSLASVICGLIPMDLLILLTDVNGLFAEPPTGTKKTHHINQYSPTQHIEWGPKSRVGRGGMEAKIDAAKTAIERGVGCVVIANGHRRHTIARVLKGDNKGTLFDHNAISPPLPVPRKFAGHILNPDTDFDEERDEKEDACAETARIADMGNHARQAGRALLTSGTEIRRKILLAIAEDLITKKDEILAENTKDVELALTTGVAPELRRRLNMNEAKLQTLSDGIRAIAEEDECIGTVVRRTEVAEGLDLVQQTAPIGVLLIIFESRPDALPQIAALAIKSGNGLLLKGGKEAKFSNRILHSIISSAIERVTEGKVSGAAVSLVEGRDEIKGLLELDHVIDLVIPRGSSTLVKYIQENTKIPVLGHAAGICHVYVDAKADLAKAVKICVDSKIDYPAACNASETLLLHKEWLTKANDILTPLREKNVRLYGGPTAVAELNLAKAQNLATEYGDLSLTVEIVDDVNEAITFINQHGSSHTDVIITEDEETANIFIDGVDSACVFHNASTRFADGFRFGLGAEVGISTGRIHARGPVGVDGLLTTKWVMRSATGHAVCDFSGPAPVHTYTHKHLPTGRA